MRRFIAAGAAAFGLTGCASSSTVPLALDTVQITTHVAPVCGMAGAQRLALRQAAVETIKRGYDKFVILNDQYQSQTQVSGYTPVVAQSSGFASINGPIITGSSTTTYSGGQPIVATSHLEGLVVKMFKNGDPAGANALPARETLGPDWQKLSQEKTLTCLS